MPKIINAYSSNDSIADAIKGLGESMFGDADKHELYRQGARDKSASASGKERENASIAAAMRAYREHNMPELAAEGIGAGLTGRNVADYNLLHATQNTKDINDPLIGIAQLGAHEPFGATRAGQDLLTERSATTQKAIGERQAQAIEGNAARDAARQERQFANEFVDLRRPDGAIVKVPRSEVPARQAEGFVVQPSMDQIKAQMFAPPTGAPTQPGPQDGVPQVRDAIFSPQPMAQQSAATTAPAAPQIPADVDRRAVLGLPHAEEHMVNRTTGETGTSVDGGQSVRLQDGRRIPVSGTPWVKIQSNERADLDRAYQIRKQIEADQPVNIEGWEKTGAGRAAHKASGLVTSGVPLAANHILGDTELPSYVLQALGLSGRIAPETTDARHYMQQLEKKYTTASGAYGEARPNKYLEQQQVASGPQWGAFNAPLDAQATVGQTFKTLMERDADLRAAINDPTTPPGEINKLHTAYRSNRELIQYMLTDYSPPAPGAPAANGQPTAQPATPGVIKYDAQGNRIQ